MTNEPISQPTDSHKAVVTSAGEGPALLDLSAPERVVRLRFRQQVARHFFRVLTMADWLAYVKTANAPAIVQGESWSQDDHEDEAAIELWENAVLRLEGYKLPPGDDWRGRIPVAHIRAAVEGLQEIYLGESLSPFDQEADSQAVVLEVAWNEQVFDKLVHRFSTPGREIELRYRRVKASYYRVRGARRDTTQISTPARLKEMCELYDQLILGVEGYKFCPEFIEAQPLTTPKEIARWMDPLQKQAAVWALLRPPISKRESEEQEA